MNCKSDGWQLLGQAATGLRALNVHARYGAPFPRASSAQIGSSAPSGKRLGVELAWPATEAQRAAR
eukprot:10937021-Alexandrium_andersonii.AAC.1